MKTKARTENAHGGCGAARLLACSSCGEMPTMTHSIHGKEKYAVWCDNCKMGGPVRVYRMRAARDWNKGQQANDRTERRAAQARKHTTKPKLKPATTI